MTLTTLCKEAHDNAVDKGFYGKHGGGERNFCELIALIITELAEAIESHRSGKDQPSNYEVNYFANHADFSEVRTQELFKSCLKDSIGDEIADSVIRIGDLCGYLGIDLESHVKAKMKYNATREQLHGKRY